MRTHETFSQSLLHAVPGTGVEEGLVRLQAYSLPVGGASTIAPLPNRLRQLFKQEFDDSSCTVESEFHVTTSCVPMKAEEEASGS